MLLHQLRVRLISFDRPGYGGSDRLVGRCVADAAKDVAAVADAYGLERFAVVGRSGGGPHALACAALLPDRTTRAAVLVGLAPREAEGLDWFDGMSDSNVAEFTAAVAGRHRLSPRLTAAADAIRADPASLVVRLQAEVPECDRRVIADARIRSMLARNYAEGLRRSASGWIDDVLALCAPWGFDPAAVRAPVLLWHGDRDAFSPVGHARWLADKIPHATVLIQPGAAHFGALDILPDVLCWLVGDL
jgi:pimeloyl-ACP methyl ester carboxylesterase